MVREPPRSVSGKAASLSSLAAGAGAASPTYQFRLVRLSSGGIRVAPQHGKQLAKDMAQSIPRGLIRACLFVHTTEVLVLDRLGDPADAFASLDRVVAGRQLGDDHDDPINPPTVYERGRLPLLPLLGAGAPHKEAIARITAE
jgi:hypothetical protein